MATSLRSMPFVRGRTGELVTLLGPSAAARRPRCGCGRARGGDQRTRADRGTDVTLRAANERNVTWCSSRTRCSDMTVLENVCYGPLSMPSPRPRPATWPARAEMPSCRFRGALAVGALGRQQQRVAVARSLGSAGVLLFDEPRRSRCEAAPARPAGDSRLHNRSALTVIYVTHDQEEALAVSDHIIVMDSGRIAQKVRRRALRGTASRFPRRFHRRRQSGRRRARSAPRRDVHRRRCERCGARERRCTGSGHARGAAASPASRKAGEGAAGICSVPPTSAAGSSIWGDPMGRAPRIRRNGARRAGARTGRRDLRPGRCDRAAR